MGDQELITLHLHLEEEPALSMQDIFFSLLFKIRYNCVAVVKDDRIEIHCYRVLLEKEPEALEEWVALEDLWSEFAERNCIDVNGKRYCGEDALWFLHKKEREFSKKYTRKICQIALMNLFASQ